MLVVIAQDRNGEDPYNEARANVSVRGGNMQPTTPPMHCLSPQDPLSSLSNILPDLPMSCFQVIQGCCLYVT